MLTTCWSFATNLANRAVVLGVAVLPLMLVQPLLAQTFHDPGMVNAGGRAVIDRIIQQGAAGQARNSSDFDLIEHGSDLVGQSG